MTRRSIFSIILTVIILGTIAGEALRPAPATAAVKSNIAGFSGCYVAGELTAVLKNKLDKQIQRLEAKVGEWLKRKVFGKIVSLTVPVHDQGLLEAIRGFESTYTEKEVRQTIIARCLARQIMIAMNKNALEVMRTGGRDGGATFIRNWNNFQTNAQYRGENIFRAELSTTKLCDYLSDDIKKSYGVDPKKKTPITGQNTRTDSLLPFSLQANCTLPQGFTIDKYNQDFAGNGGWEAFARALEPQNNAWGLNALSQQEIAKQRSLAVSADNTQAIANNGYLGISGRGKNDSCLVKARSGECVIYKNIKTPGSYIAANINATVASEFQWLTSAQGLSTIIATATEVLVNRLLDLGSSDEGEYRTASDDDQEPIPTPNPSNAPLEPTEVLAPADAFLVHPSQASAVISAKTDLVAAGVDISGECGAFKITKAAAWLLRSSGAGLLSKPTGNNCEGYAVDIIAFPDGYIYDVIGDSGIGNIPGWSPVGCGTDGTCADRYRPAVDPGTTTSGGGGNDPGGSLGQ